MRNTKCVHQRYVLSAWHYVKEKYIYISETAVKLHWDMMKKLQLKFNME